MASRNNRISNWENQMDNYLPHKPMHLHNHCLRHNDPHLLYRDCYLCSNPRMRYWPYISNLKIIINNQLSHSGIFKDWFEMNVTMFGMLGTPTSLRAILLHTKVAIICQPSVAQWAIWPGIWVKYLLSFPQKTCHQRKLRQTKCLLFNFWMMKLTKTSILPNCPVPNVFFL